MYASLLIIEYVSCAKHKGCTASEMYDPQEWDDKILAALTHMELSL